MRSAGGSAGATACSSTRTSTSTGRERGAPGVGFYGKNTMMITREHGSWVVLGTLVTDAEIEATPPLDLDCGRCRLCIDACPTGALDEPGVLDANRCLSFWTQAPAPVPGALPRGARSVASTAATSARTSAPGIAASRSGAPTGRSRPVRPRTSRSSTGSPRDGAELVDEVDRLYVPRNDPRWLRRNALTALGNVGAADDRHSPRHGWRATTRCSPRRPPGRSSGSRSGRMSGDPSGLAVLVARDPEPRCRARRDRGCLSRRRRGERRKRLLELAAAALVSIERLLVEAPTVSHCASTRLDAGRLARDAAETAALTSGFSVRRTGGGRPRRRRATPSGCDRRSTT